MKTRLLIVDDLPQVREGLKTILDLQEDMEVVGEAINGIEAVTLARTLDLDIMLMDMEMPGMGGIEATRHIKAQPSSPAIIILTIHTEEQYRQSAIEAGADAYIEKSEGIDKVIEAIQKLSLIA